MYDLHYCKFTVECVIVTASERHNIENLSIYSKDMTAHGKKRVKSTAVYCSCVIEIKQRTGICNR